MRGMVTYELYKVIPLNFKPDILANYNNLRRGHPVFRN